jgi:hypothetical protein
MQVIITLDKYDGSQGKAIECDLAEISLNQLAFEMMQANVCGFTVTKVTNLTKAVEKASK